MGRHNEGIPLSFQGRAKRAMRDGNLRVADLARAFGRRHSTVRGWVVDGREPDGTGKDLRRLFSLLVRLEAAVREGRFFALSRARRFALLEKLGR